MVLILLLVCIGLSIIPIYNKKIEYFVASIIFGIMVCIFVGNNSSTDQFAYSVLYSDNSYFPVEKGYLILTNFFLNLGASYAQFKGIVILISAILVLSKIKGCSRLNYRVILLLWLATSYWFEIEQSRYMIASSIVIFATKYKQIFS